MTDDEKFNFLLDKGPEYIDLIQDYVLDLKIKGNFENPALANSYFEAAVGTWEKGFKRSMKADQVLKNALKT